MDRALEGAELDVVACETCIHVHREVQLQKRIRFLPIDLAVQRQSRLRAVEDVVKIDDGVAEAARHAQHGTQRVIFRNAHVGDVVDIPRFFLVVRHQIPRVVHARTILEGDQARGTLTWLHQVAVFRFAEIAGNIPVFVKFNAAEVVFQNGKRCFRKADCLGLHDMIGAVALGRDVLGKELPASVRAAHRRNTHTVRLQRKRLRLAACKAHRRGTREGQRIEHGNAVGIDVCGHGVERTVERSLCSRFDFFMMLIGIAVDRPDGRTGDHIVELVQKQQLPALVQRGIGRVFQKMRQNAQILGIVQTEFVLTVSALDARLRGVSAAVVLKIQLTVPAWHAPLPLQIPLQTMVKVLHAGEFQVGHAGQTHGKALGVLDHFLRRSAAAVSVAEGGQHLAVQVLLLIALPCAHDARGIQAAVVGRHPILFLLHLLLRRNKV